MGNSRADFVHGERLPPFHSDAVSPSVYFSYGITDHVSVDLGLSGIYWSSDQLPGSEGSGTSSASGIGDTALILQYRPILQNPNNWHPSLGTYTKLSLPTSRWFGTTPPPGGFTPFSRVPDTRFGSLAITQGLLFRKNLQPFRISGGVFYTYNAPGKDDGRTVYPGDLINGRLAFEHILSDKYGFGYTLELVTLNQLSHRLDGHSLNESPATFSLVGVQPTIEYKIFESPSGAYLVGAVGSLFSLAGQNDLDAIYPNISLKFFWPELVPP